VLGCEEPCQSISRVRSSTAREASHWSGIMRTEETYALLCNFGKLEEAHHLEAVQMLDSAPLS